MNQEGQVRRRFVRRRRTRRHRRHLLMRKLLFVTAGLALTLVLTSVFLAYLSPSLFRASRQTIPSRQSSEASRDLLVATQQEVLRQITGRPVYPYSVVKGGVQDGRELKWVADHDPVVAAHYAGFNYEHARIVKLILARSAFISYRVGNRIYWTRHRVKLRKGETLITDGRITARTRCGNRVEEVPQQEALAEEPPVEKFDEPVGPPFGTAFAVPPVPYQFVLRTPGPSPAPLGSYYPITTGNMTPITPPPLPSVCGIGKKPKGGGSSGGGKKKKGNPCGHGGVGEAPEPGTWLLMFSGLGLMFWTMRRRFGLS